MVAPDSDTVEMPSTARPYQALRLVSQRIRCEAWLMIWTLNPDTHSSMSSQYSESFVTTMASVQLMLPWQEAKRAAWSMDSIFQSSTVRLASKYRMLRRSPRACRIGMSATSAAGGGASAMGTPRDRWITL